MSTTVRREFEEEAMNYTDPYEQVNRPCRGMHSGMHHEMHHEMHHTMRFTLKCTACITG